MAGDERFHSPADRRGGASQGRRAKPAAACAQGLIDRSVRVAQDLGAIAADRKTPAAQQLRRLGLLPEDAQLVMQEVIDLRNTSQHAYWTLTPDEVHAAVNHQRQHLPAFIAALGTWVEDLPTT
ncbi:MAG: HepT-like ribonuclease domain-containing protein [Solirubrobacteraceae bacterium]